MGDRDDAGGGCCHHIPGRGNCHWDGAACWWDSIVAAVCWDGGTVTGVGVLYLTLGIRRRYGDAAPVSIVWPWMWCNIL